MTSAKQFIQESNGPYLFLKRETRNTYKPHKKTTTTDQQVPDLPQVQANTVGK